MLPSVSAHGWGSREEGQLPLRDRNCDGLTTPQVCIATHVDAYAPDRAVAGTCRTPGAVTRSLAAGSPARRSAGRVAPQNADTGRELSRTT